jgi:hypothetical protein
VLTSFTAGLHTLKVLGQQFVELISAQHEKILSPLAFLLGCTVYAMIR